MRGKAQSTAAALETRLANRPAVEELAEKGLIADENGQARFSFRPPKATEGQLDRSAAVRASTREGTRP